MFPITKLLTVFPLTFLMVFLPLSVQSEEKESWTSVTLDNDVLSHTDGGYTNGLYVTFYSVYKDRKERLANLPWHLRLQKAIHGVHPKSNYVEVNNFAQIMLTPSDITVVPPDPKDTPYAGILLWQGSLLSSCPNSANMSTMLLGVLGPSSGAEPSQKFMHKIIGANEPLGWDYQIDDEPVFGLTRSRFWRYSLKKHGKFETDLITGLHGELSTLNTEVDVGAFIRWGVDLDHSHSTFALVATRESNPLAFPRSFYVYAGGSVGYSFYDLYRDGSLFQDTEEHDLDNNVARITLGGAWSTDTWGVSFSLNRTSLFGTEFSDGAEYASLTYLWKY